MIAPPRPRRAGVDSRRLLRALGLEVQRTDPDTYVVTGGRRPHQVRRRGGGWGCDCADAAYRPGHPCKHRLAVYLARQLVPAVRDGLRQALEAIAP
jgi:hypothetical protein